MKVNVVIENDQMLGFLETLPTFASNNSLENRDLWCSFDCWSFSSSGVLSKIPSNVIKGP